MCLGIGRFCKHLGKRRRTAPLSPELAAWFAAKGDETYRLDYDGLGPDSLIFDLGGYEGKWSMDIFCRYMPHIYIFEPIPAYCHQIHARFKHNPKVKVFEFGLGASECYETLHLGDDASSILWGDGKGLQVPIKQISRFILDNDVPFIDLMKINIEGPEYEVIQDLYEASLLKRVNHLQIQFHNFVPDAETKLEKTRALLRETHNQDWAFKFVWEHWTLSPSQR